jgi:hypothetical protein
MARRRENKESAVPYSGRLIVFSAEETKVTEQLLTPHS